MDQISVIYVGRKPIDWDPAVAPTEDAATTSPTTPDPRFVAAIQTNIDAIDNDARLSAAERVERITPFVALRALVHDPSAHLTNMTAPVLRNVQSAHIYGILDSMASSTARLMDTGNTAPGVPRDAADRRAQKTVPKRYGNRCVLTGTAKPQGAHILPVRTKGADHVKTWRFLQLFWSLPDLEELVVHGREQENILPLTHTFHAFWDLFYFALRPIVHPQDPAHRLYLQLVWLKDPDGGRIDRDWQHARFGGGCDFRRARDGEPVEFPALRHGDVYEFVTADPAACPLPSVRFLQIQYGVNRIMAGIQAASGLKTIFSEDPPPDSDGDAAGIQDLDAIDVAPAWRSTLDAAVDAGVLDEQAAVRWGRALARAASDRQAKREMYLARLERIARGEEEEEEEEDP